MIVGDVLLDFSYRSQSVAGKTYVLWLYTPAILGIKSYLSNRTQRVFFNGSLSNKIQVESGIPEGSCLGPLLLFIFTNDMPLALTK